MPLDVRVYRVLIASPGDVQEERNIVERAMVDWNDAHSEELGIAFHPRRWERSSPSGGASGQQIINESLVDTSDLLIGIFWARVGSPTESERSGSIEEVRRVASAGKPFGLYFKTGNIPPQHAAEYADLTAFRKEAQSFDADIRGLTGEFATADDLYRKVYRHLTDVAHQLKRAHGSLPQAESAPPRGRVALGSIARSDDQAILEILPGSDSAGPWVYNVANGGNQAEIKYQVQNIGKAPARDLRARITIGDGQPIDIPGRRILESLETAEREGFVLKFTEPFPTYASGPVPEDYPDSDIISITLFYRDFEHEAGEKQTEPFCFKFARPPGTASWVSQKISCPPARTMPTQIS